MNLISSVLVIVSSVVVLSHLGESVNSERINYYELKTIQGSSCKLDETYLPTDWITMANTCVKLMMSQVQKELTASLTYLAMGAHFSRDCVNRPGFAKFFFESASEERQHAIKFIDYLTMRGNLTDYHLQVLNLIPDSILNKIPMKWDSVSHAMESALALETSVTEAIRQIIIECEQGKDTEGDVELVNDYHLSDYLTGEFLDEQYKGQRKLAGYLSTLKKMENSHGKLSEFLMDKTM